MSAFTDFFSFVGPKPKTPAKTPVKTPAPAPAKTIAKTYAMTMDENLRGMKVAAPPLDSVNLYREPNPALQPFASANYAAKIGITYLGIATGNVVGEGDTKFVEVFFTEEKLLNDAEVTQKLAYALYTDVKFEINTEYKPEDDPRKNDPNVLPTPTQIPAGEIVPGNGKVGVTDPATGTVKYYTLTELFQLFAAKQQTQRVEENKNKKWLTYGMYVVIGLAAITLTVVLVRVLKAKKTTPSPTPAKP